MRLMGARNESELAENLRRSVAAVLPRGTQCDNRISNRMQTGRRVASGGIEDRELDAMLNAEHSA